MAEQKRSASRARPWKRAVAWTVVVAMLLVAFGSGLAFLRSLADDDVAAPDAVVVLGGGAGERVALGRELADRHDVPLVLFSGAITEGRRAGLNCSEPVWCELPDPDATRGEARMVAALADTHGWGQVVVTTARFHVGRTRLLMGQCHDEVALVGATREALSHQHVWAYGREAIATLAAITVHRAC